MTPPEHTDPVPAPTARPHGAEQTTIGRMAARMRAADAAREAAIIAACDAAEARTAAMPQAPAPEAGERWTCGTESGTRTVTVTHVWTPPAADKPYVAFEWRDDKPGLHGSVLDLPVFLGTYKPEQAAVTVLESPDPAPGAEVEPAVGTLRQRIEAAAKQAVDAWDEDVLHSALADALLPLFVDHTRELASLVQQRIELDRADDATGGKDVYRHHRRGGMMSARQLLDRYADQLDQAAGGEQA